MQKYPRKTVQVALTGASYVQLVAAPPDAQTAYRVLRVFGKNTAGGARTLSLAFNNNGTRTVIWQSASTADAGQFNQATLGDETPDLDITLSLAPSGANTGHALDMVLNDTGTDTIVAVYEILEA